MAVYFVRRKDDPVGLIKIGSSGNMRMRREVQPRLAWPWFRPTVEVMVQVARAKAVPNLPDEKGPKQPKSHLVTPEDEFSDDIAVESRFYLNGLVTREWCGVGDTPEEARIRVAERLGLTPEKCRRIWYSIAHRIDGDTYRVLNNEYARVMVAEGRATARHIEVLRLEKYFQEKRARESHQATGGSVAGAARGSSEQEMR